MAQRTVRRSIAIGLGTICVVSLASLAGIFAYYIPMINDKNNMISSLNTQISQLNSNITNLRNQIASDNSTIYSLMSNVTILQKGLNDLLNETVWMSLDELQANYLNYVNRKVAVEGNLTGPFGNIPENEPPWNYEWVNSDGTRNHLFGVFSPRDEILNSTHVIVIGVVKEGKYAWIGLLLPAYFIDAETITVL
jgi:hypothetical protein